MNKIYDDKNGLASNSRPPDSLAMMEEYAGLSIAAAAIKISQ